MFMQAFWEIVTGAPWWVYVLFIYLVTIGLEATKSRAISIKKIAIFPLLFLGWSIYDLYTKVQLGLFSMIPVWIVSLGVGIYLGIKVVSSWRISKNHTRQEIIIPGNYSTLVLVVLVFAIKFFWGSLYATEKEVSYWIYFGDTVTSALIAGSFVGRSLFFFKSYHTE